MPEWITHKAWTRCGDAGAAWACTNWRLEAATNCNFQMHMHQKHKVRMSINKMQSTGRLAKMQQCKKFKCCPVYFLTFTLNLVVFCLVSGDFMSQHTRGTNYASPGIHLCRKGLWFLKVIWTSLIFSAYVWISFEFKKSLYFEKSSMQDKVFKHLLVGSRKIDQLWLCGKTYRQLMINRSFLLINSNVE